MCVFRFGSNCRELRSRLIYASLPIDIAGSETSLVSFYGNNFQFISTGASNYIKSEYISLLLAIISQSNVLHVSLETASSAARAVLITPDGSTRSAVCDYEVVLQ